MKIQSFHDEFRLLKLLVNTFFQHHFEWLFRTIRINVCTQYFIPNFNSLITDSSFWQIGASKWHMQRDGCPLGSDHVNGNCSWKNHQKWQAHPCDIPCTWISQPGMYWLSLNSWSHYIYTYFQYYFVEKSLLLSGQPYSVKLVILKDYLFINPIDSQIFCRENII